MGKKLLTIDFVKQEFIKRGLELLSTEYINCKIKLDYRCKRCNAVHRIKWKDFQQGCGCPCNKKPPIVFIRKEMSRRGYTLLSTEYINCKSNLECICPAGHIHLTTWLNWKNNVTPKKCYKNPKIGARLLNLPYYKTYAPQLEKYEQVYLIQQGGFELLGVNCFYCNKIFVPKGNIVFNRMHSIKGKQKGEQHFYCSDACKQACPTYGQYTYPKGYAPATPREMQPQFRKMVLERDNWTCQKCGANKETSIETELHAHHIDPVISNPIESCDVDNGITLCIDCPTQVHQIPGCTLGELRC